MIKTILVFVCLLLTVFLPSVSEAQQPTKVYRIGYLSAAGSDSSAPARSEAFREGLRELGYVEGKTLSSNRDLRRENWIASPLSRPNSCDST